MCALNGFCHLMVPLDFYLRTEEFDKSDYLCINIGMKECDRKQVIVSRVHFNRGYSKDDHIIGNPDSSLAKPSSCVQV